MDLKPDKDKGIIDKLRRHEERELMDFLSKVMDQIKDEDMAFTTYSEMADKTKDLGLMEESITLRMIAEQEKGHKQLLSVMATKVSKM